MLHACGRLARLSNHTSIVGGANVETMAEAELPAKSRKRRKVTCRRRRRRRAVAIEGPAAAGDGHGPDAGRVFPALAVFPCLQRKRERRRGAARARSSRRGHRQRVSSVNSQKAQELVAVRSGSGGAGDVPTKPDWPRRPQKRGAAGRSCVDAEFYGPDLPDIRERDLRRFGYSRAQMLMQAQVNRSPAPVQIHNSADEGQQLVLALPVISADATRRLCLSGPAIVRHR